MKKFISFMIMAVISLDSVSAMAACDFAKDIVSNPDGTYTYSKECHIEVGKKVKKLEIAEARAEELEKAIELKDLALVKQKERADLWMDTSLKMNEKLRQYDSMANTDRVLHFALGVGVTILSVWAAGQIR